MIRQALKKNGAGRLIRQLESYLFSLSAAIIYTGLIAIKLLTGKQIVFCEFYSSRIGHLAAELELFLRRLGKGGFYNKNNTIYIGFCKYFPVANDQLLGMYKRYLFIIKNKLFAKSLNKLKNTQFYLILPYRVDEYYEFNELSPVLSFTGEERLRGRKLLSKMGIGEEDWFVCFHSRDSKYLGKGWSYHDYRDSDINNYLKAAEYIVAQGGYALRIGSVVEKPLPKERHPRIIDYAVEYRSDFMDIYLLANCRYFLGNTAGPFVISSVFNVPVACANFIPMNHTPLREGDLFIPKKLFKKDQGRFLTFKEIQESEMAGWGESTSYKNAGIDIIENSADEILELTREMDLRLKGKYKPYRNDEEEYLKKYRAILGARCNGSPARIGSYFLTKNKDLLEVRN